MPTKRGFTFIEILVVIAVVAVLAAIVALIINPAEYLRRARDAQRLGDASRINQAMALYNFGASSRALNQDPDGPKFPDSFSPPAVHDSCISDSNQRIFVSVPKDNGEDNPTPPSGWNYARVTSTQLRSVDGTGWLPVDFKNASSNTPPFAVLPVDPVNTFSSGYYYSYGCGSWNIDMRFESTKYQDLAATDSGQFSNVYEVGSDLNVLPLQPAYNPTSTIASGSFVMRPSAVVGTHLGWTDNSCVGSNCVSDTSNLSSISSFASGASSTYIFQSVSVPVFNSIDSIAMTLTAKSALSIATTTPFLSYGGITYTNGIVSVSSSGFQDQTTVTFTNSTLLNALNSGNINALIGGIILTNAPSSGSIFVSEFILTVNYH